MVRTRGGERAREEDDRERERRKKRRMGGKTRDSQKNRGRMPSKRARRQERARGTSEKSKGEIHMVTVKERGAQAAPPPGLMPSAVPEEKSAEVVGSKAAMGRGREALIFSLDSIQSNSN